MTPDKLEPYFASWEAKWVETKKDINNPKVPLAFVMEHGEIVYSDQQPLDLVKAGAVRRARATESANRKAAKKKALAVLVQSRNDTEE